MKNVFENIIEKLEKIEEHCLEMNDWQGQSAIVDAIEIVKQDAQAYNGGWIPCSKRLPGEGNEFYPVCLVTLEMEM